jgi:fermentation-respiration switch protein FrsA (DUF1100 family)
VATLPQADKKPRTWRYRLFRWCCVLCVGYLGALLVLLLLENWLIYRPSGPEDWLAKPQGEIEDVALVSADGTRLHGWWYAKPGSGTALLFFHGNAGNLSWRGDAMMSLRDQLDVGVLIIDYPGYGKSQGRPTEAGCYAAADAAYDWLTTEQRIPGPNVLLCGESLGGGVAVDLASRKPHRALILIKTFTSMPDVGQGLYPFMPVRLLMRNRFDSLAKLDDCKQPIFVAHGDNDHVIPFSHGERLYTAAHAPKQFLRLEGADHNDPLPFEFYEQLKSFLAASAPLPVDD